MGRVRVLTPVVLVAILPLACSTATLHPELVAKAAKVRVVRNGSEVQGCQFLQSVTATEEPGFTASSGVVIDPGTPAITLLQLHASEYGADTVEITSEGRSYRAGVGKSGGRAQTLTTMTGSAYRCGDSQHQQGQPAAAISQNTPSTGQQDAAPPSLFGKWRPDQIGGVSIVVESATLLRNGNKTYNPMIVFSCDDDKKLTAGLIFSGSADRTVRVAFDDLPPRAVECVPLQGAGFVFPAPDRLADYLRAHDRVTITLERPDGPVVLGFDIRGFSEAVKPILRVCGAARPPAAPAEQPH